MLRYIQCFTGYYGGIDKMSKIICQLSVFDGHPEFSQMKKIFKHASWHAAVSRLETSIPQWTTKSKKRCICLGTRLSHIGYETLFSVTHQISTHLSLCLATASHNFKCVKITLWVPGIEFLPCLYFRHH